MITAMYFKRMNLSKRGTHLCKRMNSGEQYGPNSLQLEDIKVTKEMNSKTGEPKQTHACKEQFNLEKKS